MTIFRIEQIQPDVFWIFYGDRKVAILLPPVEARAWPPAPAEPWSIIIDPAAFPDAACTGLPRPLSPVGNRFDTFEQVEAFLGLRAAQEAQAA